MTRADRSISVEEFRALQKKGKGTRGGRSGPAVPEPTVARWLPAGEAAESPTLLLTTRLPDRALSPNARTHHHAKAAAVKAARESACLVVRGAGSPSKWARAVMRATFYWPTKANRDDDNANASLKAHRDGIADGLNMNDSRIIMLPPIMAHDPRRPRVVIAVWESGI